MNSYWLPQKDQRSKFWKLVWDYQVPCLLAVFCSGLDKFKCRMMPAYRHVCYPYFTLRASANFYLHYILEIDDVNCFWRAVCYWFYYHMSFRILMYFKIEQTHLFAIWKGYLVAVSRLADFAFEASPDIWIDIRSLFFMLLAIKPFSDAIEMYKFYRSDAGTWWNNRIARFFFRKTNPATYFVCWIRPFLVDYGLNGSELMFDFVIAIQYKSCTRKPIPVEIEVFGLVVHIKSV